MSRNVFISFSSKDRAVSEKICDALESRGHRCWISTRSIRPGENFQESIVAAIRAARVMVLVFTRHANESSEIKKELALASQGGLAVIPVRMEDILPNDAFAYEFATRQWLDLSSDWDRHIEVLAAEIERHVSPGLTDPDPAAPTRSALAGKATLAAPVMNNLPVQATSFIGRAADLQELTGLITAHRIVTLLGSGGLGKTRLSLEAAGQIKNAYPDGVWFLELAPISDPRLVAESLATLLGLPVPEGRTATEVAGGYLRHKTVLVILDNCEHLIASAALAEGLTRACPGCSVVASSREPLGVSGEMIFRMPLLGVPPAGSALDAAGALTYPAIRLFVDRAASALGRYELSDADAPIVAAICRQLDGIALAIELAAPRLKMLKPAQLLERLADRFKILTGGSRTALPRQQTLRALLDFVDHVYAADSVVRETTESRIYDRLTAILLESGCDSVIARQRGRAGALSLDEAAALALRSVASPDLRPGA